MIRNKNLLVLFVVGLVTIILLGGCIGPTSTLPDQNKITLKEAELPKFSSCSAIVDAFKSSPDYGGHYKAFDFAMVSTPSAMASAAEDSGATPEYSTTNVQVAGVDEADIIKTDGRYIYAVSGNSLHIVAAYPPANASLVSSVQLNNIKPYEIFVDGDVIALFGHRYPDYDSGVTNSKPSYYYYDLTVIQLWNVSDKKNPELVRTIHFEGDYVSSRKVNSTVYFVVQKYEYLYQKNPDDIVPLYKDGKGDASDVNYSSVARCVEVSYLPPIQAKSFVIVGSVSMSDLEAPINKKVIVASGENVYASLENLYIAEVERGGYWIQVAKIPIDLYRPKEKTTVHKFSFSSGDIVYVGSMNVSGRILNQFSMDECDGYFRIATTTGEVSPYGTSTASNNVYTFDSELNLKGKLEGLAPGEKIYAARFVGDKAYLVTFKKIDPLFVIDLKDQENPKVLGKLKIPGYSDYLHQLDENHILGIGKETVEAEEGDFAWYQGIKMAVFDVSDVSKPKELHKIIIGDRGTDSYALRDHRAFLYDDKRDLLVIPILLAEIDEDKYDGGIPSYYYGDYTFQGAYVFNLTVDYGFNLRGRITHVEDNETFAKSGYYYYDSGDLIKRSLFIDNVLYTFSDKKILANDLLNLEQLAEIRLEKEKIH